jgi:hypothetical protein
MLRLIHQFHEHLWERRLYDGGWKICGRRPDDRGGRGRRELASTRTGFGRSSYEEGAKPSAMLCTGLEKGVTWLHDRPGKSGSGGFLYRYKRLEYEKNYDDLNSL